MSSPVISKITFADFIDFEELFGVKKIKDSDSEKKVANIANTHFSQLDVKPTNKAYKNPLPPTSFPDLLPEVIDISDEENLNISDFEVDFSKVLNDNGKPFYQ